MNPETGAIPKSRVAKSKSGLNVGTKAKANTKMATRTLPDITKEVPQITEFPRKQLLRMDNRKPTAHADLQMPTRKSKRLSGNSMESENGLVNRQIKKPSTVTLSSLNETNGVVQVPATSSPLTKKKKITEADIFNEIENSSRNSIIIVNSINDEEINQMLNDSFRRYGVEYNGSPNRSNKPKSDSYIDLTSSFNMYSPSTSNAQIPAPVFPKERVPKKTTAATKKTDRKATNRTVRPNIVPLETITLDTTLDDTAITLDDSFSNLVVGRKTKSTRAEKKTETSTVSIASCSSSNSSPTILNNRLECPICLECVPGLQGLQVSSTTCGHLFCRPCIVESLKSSKFCPSCRKVITLKSLLNVYM